MIGVNNYLEDVREIGKYLSILWSWTLIFKFKVEHDATHSIYYLWSSDYHKNLCFVSTTFESMFRNSKHMWQYCDFDPWPWNSRSNMTQAFYIFLAVYIIETCVWCLQLLNWCHGIQKHSVNIVTMTFELEIQVQTWHKAFSLLSLITLYIIENCVWCLQLLKICHAIQNICITGVTLTSAYSNYNICQTSK